LIRHRPQHHTAGLPHGILERGRQRLLALIENLIERSTREPRTLAQHRDCQHLRTTLKHKFHRRGQQPTTLHPDNMPTLTTNITSKDHTILRARPIGEAPMVRHIHIPLERPCRHL
jgi:hypothetical protein